MFERMPLDQTLVGRSFPPTSPRTVTEPDVQRFATAIGDPESATDGAVPLTYPIVLAFEAMNAFLAAEQVELSRIVHGEQRFAYARPLQIGDTLTATLTVSSLRQIGGNDIIGTASEVRDAAGDVVCTTSATLVHRAGEGA